MTSKEIEGQPPFGGRGNDGKGGGWREGCVGSVCDAALQLLLKSNIVTRYPTLF